LRLLKKPWCEPSPVGLDSNRGDGDEWTSTVFL
jgi:hypothetical protein